MLHGHLAKDDADTLPSPLAPCPRLRGGERDRSSPGHTFVSHSPGQSGIDLYTYFTRETDPAPVWKAGMSPNKVVVESPPIWRTSSAARRSLAALLVGVGLHSATMSAGSASTLALVPVCSSVAGAECLYQCRPRAALLSLRASRALSFEPPRGHGLVEDGVQRLREWVSACGDERILVISGAGLSTASGIPDYRSPHGSYSKGRKPMQHDEFLLLEGQRRYWSRSMVGWRAFNTAQERLSRPCVPLQAACGEVLTCCPRVNSSQTTGILRSVTCNRAVWCSASSHR